MFGLSDLEIILSGGVAILSALGLKDVLLKKIISKKEEVENESFAIKTMKEVLVVATSNYNESTIALKSDLTELKSRVDALEERERHMLTRAAVHEAWDQMAFKMLLAQNPEHPPPPPLRPTSIEGEYNGH